MLGKTHKDSGQSQQLATSNKNFFLLIKYIVVKYNKKLKLWYSYLFWFFEISVIMGKWSLNFLAIRVNCLIE